MINELILSLRRFGDGGMGDVSAACRKAADEIERLLVYQNETAKAWTKLTESQEQEIERLRAEVSLLWTSLPLQEARAEIERLRAETGWLIEFFGWGAPTYYGKIHEGLGMTRDHTVAVRYARKIDADMVIDDVGWTRPNVQAIEHTWRDGVLHSLAARSALR